MKINELINKYYFHDSLVTNISSGNNEVKINIELCNWKQKGYLKNEPEMKEIEVIFKDVSCCKFDFIEGNIDYDTILEVSYSGENNEKIKFVLEDEHNIKILEFYSKNVDINEL
ncbi:hypothetical protein CM240_2894 [Clostridium bornimense]|uniref:Uncharacterized protein n=2 Tax=Clostridium bornimense TaxID=1216932 RepID=W6RZD7_9CLOT|nr:hypothetical protein CM240_2894 [Clostridium bornimense]